MVKKNTDKKTTKTTTKKTSSRYFEGKGGRKTSIARARVSESQKGIVVNDKPYGEYFKQPRLQREVLIPFEVAGVTGKMGATVKVRGGGIKSQAEAVRHGISRALVLFNEDLRKVLRKEGYLTRDPRMVERKKYGLRKARRAPQWAKR
ncbi:30S ribosomal protein S9 [Candidatus Wolfebacteria bacterium]|nr:30S ribosomal protein S9 [Candidatus Wolfebacteria bacterium]